MDAVVVHSKKSRAKSCTACRQVKLRCDVREKYPAPCSRCVGRKLECRMDPNFKRVSTKSISHTLSEPSTIFHSSVTPQSLEHHDIEAQLAPRTRSPDRSGALFASAPAPQLWFDKEIYLDEQQLRSSYKLGDVVVEGVIIVDLYQQFEDLYYAHFPILEPITSFAELYKDSPVLFWAIAITTCRFHPRHFYLHALLLRPFEQLFASLLLRVPQRLKDLQALLMICQWPLELRARSDDDLGWMYIGFVVNAALHMGLDKVKTEVLMNHNLEDNPSSIDFARYRRRTWMKIFQISTHLAMWLGLRPPIGSPSALHELSGFYEKETNREIVAATEIQRQMVRNTNTLDEYGFRGPQATLLQSIIQELDAIKERFGDVWNDSLSINFHAAKLFTLEQCLILAADQLKTASLDAEHFVTTALQMGHGPAISLIEAMRKQCVKGQLDPFCAPLAAGGSPLLSNPKHHSRVAFYACIFLIHYLDHTTFSSGADQNAARAAVTDLHRVFMQFPSRGLLTRAGRTIEVIARSIVPGRRRLKPIVKSRMGGSLIFNSIWLVSQLRRREDPDDLTVSPAQTVSEAGGQNDNAAVESSTLEAMVSLPEPEFFPWGIWNDQLYDDLGINWEGQGFQGFSGTIDPF
ncbi:hypothetical protein DM02DRAFT_704147 [Periconia macrospinosa]|uniref:Zn(2)-C6 fungal-type domain-containing protein n=1 Tax=Periconia macrospinosa TaxID=97972 RepID=A0A2V1DUL0_9PLEO|nr:hypothetical protein DM02DRAFT_704147 [Periconia macrospinosa]